MGLSADVAKRINPFMKSKGFRRMNGNASTALRTSTTPGGITSGAIPPS
jgi:hypothetical protein